MTMGAPFTFRRALFPILLLLILLLPSTNILADTFPLCTACGKGISGQYVEVDGHPYHKACVVCAVCGKPIEGRYGTKDGRLYHPACFAEAFAPKCAWCGEPMVGEYISIEGKNYHDACYRDHVAPECDLCGAPITGKYLEDGWGQRVHAGHIEHLERCASCSRFLLDQRATRLPDGRFLCEACAASSVHSEAAARRLMRDAVKILAAQGIRMNTPLDRINLKLVDRPTIQEIGGFGEDTFGVHQVLSSKTREGRVVLEETTIYAMDDLPEDQLLSVLAHELFHVWQHERGADGGPAAWREGSANVAGWLALKTRDSDLARFLVRSYEETTDPVYGEGFRRARELFEREGKVAFLARVMEEGQCSER